MKLLKANQMAGILPPALFVHQVEEFYTNFPLLFSNQLNAQLSDQDFITINGLGLVIVSVLSFSYFFNKNNFILVALGSLVFVNGVVHIIASIFSLAYVPGLISGTLLFIPIGVIVFRKVLPILPEWQRIVAIASGVIALISVSLVALNI